MTRRRWGAFGWTESRSLRLAIAGASALHLAALLGVVSSRALPRSGPAASRMNVIRDQQEMLIEPLEGRPMEAEHGAPAPSGVGPARTLTSHARASTHGGALKLSHTLGESSGETDPSGPRPSGAVGDAARLPSLPSLRSATTEAGGHDGIIGALGARGGFGHDGHPTDTPAHGPILLDKDTGCQRYFPFSAPSRTREASVTLTVEVSPSGHADAARIIDERPPREGFGSAASSCVLKSLSFAPAIDRGGAPVRATSTLQLRFTRRAHSG